MTYVYICIYVIFRFIMHNNILQKLGIGILQVRNLCRIWGSHIGDYEELCLLACNAV